MSPQKKLRGVVKEIRGKVGFEVHRSGVQFPQSALVFHLVMPYPKASVFVVVVVLFCFLFLKFIYLFIFGCIGSLLLCAGFF